MSVYDTLTSDPAALMNDETQRAVLDYINKNFTTSGMDDVAFFSNREFLAKEQDRKMREIAETMVGDGLARKWNNGEYTDKNGQTIYTEGQFLKQHLDDLADYNNAKAAGFNRKQFEKLSSVLDKQKQQKQIEARQARWRSVGRNDFADGLETQRLAIAAQNEKDLASFDPVSVQKFVDSRKSVLERNTPDVIKNSFASLFGAGVTDENLPGTMPIQSAGEKISYLNPNDLSSERRGMAENTKEFFSDPKNIPVAGTLYGIKDAASMIQSAKRAEMGSEYYKSAFRKLMPDAPQKQIDIMSENAELSDRNRVISYMNSLREQELRGDTRAGTVLRIFLDSAPYMIDFMATAGITGALSSGAKAAAKTGAKELAKQTVKETGEQAVKAAAKSGTLRHFATTAPKNFARLNLQALPLTIARTPRSGLERYRDAGISLDESGNPVFDESADLGGSFASGAVESATETAGEASGELLRAPVPRRIQKIVAKAKRKLPFPRVLREARKLGFHGTVGEVAEEFNTAWMNAAAGLDSTDSNIVNRLRDATPSREDTENMFIAFAMTSLGLRGVQGALDFMNNRKFRRLHRELSALGRAVDSEANTPKDAEEAKLEIVNELAENLKNNSTAGKDQDQNQEPVPQTQEQNMEEENSRNSSGVSEQVQSVPVSSLKIDPKRFQFKSSADKVSGVDNSNQIGGTFDHKTAGNLLVWEAKNGDRFVVNGHHRYKLAKDTGVKNVNVIIEREEDGVSAEDARKHGVLTNIRDGQGSVQDYAEFVRAENMDEKTAEREGILAREKGRRGYTIGKFASDNLFSQVKDGSISPASAAVIAQIAQKNEALEAAGITAAIKKNMSDTQLKGYLQLLSQTDRTSNADADLFGFDDSAMKKAEELSRLAAKHIRDVGERVRVAKNAVRNPEAAGKMDVNVGKNAQNMLNDAVTEQKRWENWYTDPRLYHQLEEELSHKEMKSKSIGNDDPLNFALQEKFGKSVSVRTAEPANKAQKAVRDFFRKEFETDVEFFDSDTLKADGFVRNGKIYLNRAGQKPMMVSAFHEFTHQMRVDSPEEFQKLLASIIAISGKKELADWKKNYNEKYRAAGYSELDDGTLDEEFIADVVGGMGGNAEFLKRLAGENKGILERFLDWIRNLRSMMMEKGYGQDVEKVIGKQLDNAIREVEFVLKKKMADKPAEGVGREQTETHKADKTDKTDGPAQERKEKTQGAMKVGPENLHEINSAFNDALEKQIKGELPDGYVYSLGKPSDILLGTGIPNLPIELASSRLSDKSKQSNHPFKIGEVKNLPIALQNPFAVFRYGDETKAQNIIVNIQHENKNFLVGIHLNKNSRGIEINSIRGLFPKDLHEWLNWIQQGKALYLDKKKIQTLIAQQRINLADVDYLDLDSVEKIIHDFENFKKNPGKISEISQKNVLEPERRNPYLTMPIDIVRRHAETGVQLAKEALRKRTEEKQNKVGPEQSKEKKEEKTNVPASGKENIPDKTSEPIYASEEPKPVIEYVKKPSGVDFSKAKIYRDKEYRRTRVRMAEKDGDLYAEFGGSKEKAQYIKIANYADTTPADIIRNIPDQGRHFEDALHDFYAERNLQQGYVVDIFKKKTASPPNNNQEEHSRTPKATEQQVPEKEKSENAEKKLTLEKILDSDKDNAGKKLLLKRFAFDHKIPLKEAEEQMEFLVVQKARKIAHDSSISEDDAFQKILHLYEQMPLLNSRTSTSVMNQAYSTPVPLAYMLGRAIGIQNAKRVYEPTAGNGALLIAAKPESVSANEIEKIRNGILKTSGFKTVTSEDATTFSPEETQDAIIMNPPFGRLDRKVQFEKFKIAKLEHLIALQALKSLDKNGTAAIILGAADKLESKVNPTEKPFLNYIYDHFNIADSFEVAGDLYKKQGAGYPIRIIILNGRKENSDFSTEFSSKPVERLADWSNIFQRLKGVENGIAAWRKNHETELGQTGTERGNDVQHNALDHGRTAEDGKRSGAVSGKSDLADAQTVQKGERSGNDPRSAGESTRELPGTPVRGGRDSSGMAELDGLRNGSEVGIENSRGTSGLAGRSGESGGLRPVLADSGNSAVEDNNSETEPELSEDGLQAKYKTQSKSESLGTLIPKFLLSATQKALKNVQKKYGSVDDFVLSQLAYDSKEELYNALAAEQIDSVALAIDNIKNGESVIIGDQTGIGKGRQAAAIMRYAKLNGITPIFITEKPKLFSDMYFDGKDIGETFHPFLIGEKDKSSIIGRDNEVIQKTLPKPSAYFSKMLADNPKNFDSVFTVYSQLNKEGNPQQRFLQNMIDTKACLLVMDEAHNASGVDSNTGRFFKGLVASKNLKGVVYLSATYAKRPENMMLFLGEKFKEIVPNILDVFKKGGLAIQQIVCQGLAESGRLIRRERDFSGVKVNIGDFVQTSDKIKRQYDEIVSFMSEMVNLSLMIKDEVESSGAKGGRKMSESLQCGEFASTVHNYVGQLLFAAKLDVSIDKIIQAYKTGQKPVVAVANTMESFLKGFSEENRIRNGEQIEISFKDILRYNLDKLKFGKLEDRNGNSREIKLNLPPHLLAILDELKSRVDNLDLDLPASPIDYMKAKLSAAGLSVGELTGRTKIIHYDENGKNGILGERSDKEKKSANMVVNDFNSGKLDCIILNRSGSTGLSLHASSKFKDQKQRHMFVVQADLDINVVMQTLGRIMRSGQVVKPEYTFISTDLEAERRVMAVLNKKFASLSANTTANTKGSMSFGNVDILNKYGDQIVAEYLSENMKLAGRVGLNVTINPNGKIKPKEDLARSFTGKMALLPNAMQKAIYQDLDEAYSDLTTRLKAIGEYDLEVSEQDWNAEEQESDLYAPGNENGSVLDKPLMLKTYKTTERIRVPDWNAFLEDREKQFGSNEISKMREHVKRQFEEQNKRLETFFNQALDSVENKTEILKRKADAKKNLNDAEREVMNFLGYPVTIFTGNNSYRGTLSYIKFSRNGNPGAKSNIKFSFLTESPVRITIPLSQIGDKAGQTAIRHTSDSMNDIFNERSSRVVENIRKVYVGNLIKGVDASEGFGKVVKFSLKNGQTQTGVSLPVGFSMNSLTRDPRRKLSTTDEILKYFEIGGRNAKVTGDFDLVIYPGRIETNAKRSSGGEIFMDEEVMKIVGDFRKFGNHMRAYVNEEQLRKVLPILLQKTQISGDLDLVGKLRESSGDIQLDIQNNPDGVGRGERKEYPRNWMADENTPVNIVEVTNPVHLTTSMAQNILKKRIEEEKKRTGKNYLEVKNKSPNGMTARIDYDSSYKMKSGKATQKSSVKPYVHAVAMVNIKKLFENAMLGVSHLDRKNEENVLQMHRFYVGMKYKGQLYGIKISVKEKRNTGNHIYSIEAHDLEIYAIKNPESVKPTGDMSGRSPDTLVPHKTWAEPQPPRLWQILHFNDFFEKFDPLNDLLGPEYSILRDTGKVKKNSEKISLSIKDVQLVSVANSDLRQNAVSGANPTLIETSSSSFAKSIPQDGGKVKSPTMKKSENSDISLSIQDPEIRKTVSSGIRWLSNAKKFVSMKDENAKADISKFAPLLGTVMYYSEKIPAYKKIFDASQKFEEDSFRLKESVFGVDETDLRCVTELKKDPKEYRKFAEYVFQKDLNADGGRVQESEKKGLFDAFDPNGNLIRTLDNEADAWNAVWKLEADSLMKTGESKAFADAVLAYRQMNARVYDILRNRAESVRKELENIETDSVEISDLFQELKKMGDRRGYYMPRLRHGRYILEAIKEGENPRLEIFDTKAARAARAATLKDQGFSEFHFRVSSTPSNAVFEDMSLLGMNDILTNAFEDVTEKAKKSFKDFGLDASWMDYIKKDGTSERHFVVRGHLTPELVKLFKEFGGRFYTKMKEWHFVAPEEGYNIDRLLLASMNANSEETKAAIAFGNALSAQMAVLVHSHGSRSRKIRRSDATGKDVYLGYEEDPIRALVMSASATAAGTAKSEMAKTMIEAFTGRDLKWKQFRDENMPEGLKPGDKDYQATLAKLFEKYEKEIEKRRIDSAKQPEAHKDAKEYIREMLRNQEPSERVFGFVRGIAALKYLSRISTGIVNLTTLITNVPAVFHAEAKIKFHETLKQLGIAANLYGKYLLYRKFGKGDRISTNDMWIFNEISKRGWDVSLVNKEATGILRTWFGNKWKFISEKMMIAMEMTERFNRAITIAAGYKALVERENGSIPESRKIELLNEAKRISDKAHGIYGKTNLPAWTRGTSIGAQALRAFYVFKPYGHNYMQELYNIGINQRDRKAFAWLLLSPMILAGPTATVAWNFMPIAVRAICSAFGIEPPDNPEEALYQFVENEFGGYAGRIARYGAIGGIGINVAPSMSMMFTKDSIPETIWDLFGAPGSVAKDVLEGTQNIAKGNIAKGLEKLSPAILASPIRAAREYSEGVTMNNNQPVFYGNRPLRATAPQSIARIFGFNPAGISEKRDKQWAERLTAQEYSKARTDIYSRLRRYYLNPNRTMEDYTELVNMIQEYNARVRRNRPAGVNLITSRQLKTLRKRMIVPGKVERMRKVVVNE
jgi:hypothetical protein